MSNPRFWPGTIDDKPLREPTPAADATDAQRARADQGAEEALVGGSFVRPSALRYSRAFGGEDGAEPSQDNSDMKLVLDTLKLIGRDIEQVEITKGGRVILINDDGNRAYYQLDIGDDSPEALRPRLEPVLAKIPQRYNEAEIAKMLATDTYNEAVENVTENRQIEFKAKRRVLFGTRNERGGLE